jgi:hypothetical protein
MAAHITGRDETSVHTTVIFCVFDGSVSQKGGVQGGSWPGP